MSITSDGNSYVTIRQASNPNESDRPTCGARGAWAADLQKGGEAVKKFRMPVILSPFAVPLRTALTTSKGLRVKLREGSEHFVFNKYRDASQRSAWHIRNTLF
jgi:hypothetical protein